MNKVQELNLTPLWLNPDHTVETARHVMTGHVARAIAILERGVLYGIVSFENLAGHSDSTRLGNVLSPVLHFVSSQSSLREVALVLSKENLEFLPVIDEGEFKGIVTATMLLREMSRTWDPLTELPWSDRLREWGVDRLMSGEELTILFVDLDDFGQYNKAHGHIVGDRVLQLVAKNLKDSIDPNKDVLVRYGGDEFAIGSTRHRRDAEDLMDAIQSRMEGAFVSGAEKPVEISIGLFGGRRTIERENIHFSSTLDSLINLASKDCLARKAAKKSLTKEQIPTSWTMPGDSGNGPEVARERNELDAAIWEPSSTPKMVEVLVDESSDRGVAMATLESNGTLWRGISARSSSASATESVALATLGALERWAEPVRFQFGSLTVDGDDTGWSIHFEGIRIEGGDEHPITSQIERAGEKMILVGEAVIQAAMNLA